MPINLKKGDLLSKMIVLAVTKHSHQLDKGGKPYILHPIAVMMLLNSEDEELLCIALGHDLIEDTDCTYQDLRDACMTERVIEGIRCLTKERGETYDEYRVKIKSNIDSIHVKKCDLRHNSDLTRLKGVTPKDIARMEKYTKLFAELSEAQVN